MHSVHKSILVRFKTLKLRVKRLIRKPTIFNQNSEERKNIIIKKLRKKN